MGRQGCHEQPSTSARFVHNGEPISFMTLFDREEKSWHKDERVYAQFRDLDQDQIIAQWLDGGELRFLLFAIPADRSRAVEYVEVGSLADLADETMKLVKRLHSGLTGKGQIGAQCFALDDAEAVWPLSEKCLATNAPKRVEGAAQLSMMILLATERHAGQFDKGGQPYILHALKVMHYVRSEDPELLAIAVGHDLVEDTFDSPEAGEALLTGAGFTQRVVAGIMALTKRKGQTYEQYKAAVKANPDAIRVKMADLRHNSDIRRLKGVTARDIERIERYHKFYLELKDALAQKAAENKAISPG